ncbi:MAG: DNA-directed RNA polymerase subunit alpha C-terminal domain-containing protein [Candidatus Moranbacteria bacterium]|nr:DNA-directed RNA polymerase subunit alpha C-terminal domain-containing protein [Candidatus Moranbacteria bacterium]
MTKTQLEGIMSSSKIILSLVLSDGKIVSLGEISLAEEKVCLINSSLTMEKMRQVENTPVTDLQFPRSMSTMILNGLKVRNIKTIGDLMRHTERELMKVTPSEKTASGYSCLGRKSIGLIADALKDYGVWIGILTKL